MNIRTSSRTIVFAHSFVLSGVEGVQPPGTYTVETEEEQLQTFSLPAYRRLSTLIRLPARAGGIQMTQVVNIDPVELSEIVVKDSQYPR
jgi:hypothetical protein